MVRNATFDVSGTRRRANLAMGFFKKTLTWGLRVTLTMSSRCWLLACEKAESKAIFAMPEWKSVCQARVLVASPKRV